MSIKNLFMDSFTITDEIRALENAAEGAYSLYVSTIPRQDEPYVESAYTDYLKFKAELSSSVARLMEYKRAILKIINELENPTHRLILENRYINRMTFEEIAEDTHYDERHVYRIHNQAMKAAERLV